ncbi:MAG: outer membrane protein [Stellaceae bacterium]
MRKLLLGTVSLMAATALAGGTAAAQMPNFFSGPAVNWTGPYAGVEGGYGWGANRQTDPTGFNSGHYSSSGGLVGGTLGYNWELPNHLVLGAETDLSWTDIAGKDRNAVCGGGAPDYCESRLDFLGTVRGRVGYSFGRIMPFATGGFAYGGLHGAESDAAAIGSGNSINTGWTAGAGVAAALAPNWSAKVEYLHVDLGNQHTFDDTVPGATVPQSLDFSSDIIRVGLDYKFQ